MSDQVLFLASHTMLLFRFRSTRTYPTVSLVPVLLPMDSGVPMSASIFVVRWSAWNIIVQSVGTWTLIITQAKRMNVNRRRWFINRWCVMRALPENEPRRRWRRNVFSIFRCRWSSLLSKILVCVFNCLFLRRFVSFETCFKKWLCTDTNVLLCFSC